MGPPSPNFGFLQAHNPLLVRLAGFAEMYATSDPNAAILRLRQFAEELRRRTAVGFGVEAETGASQFELLRELENGRLVPSQVADLFHHLRKAEPVSALLPRIRIERAPSDHRAARRPKSRR